jgi:preprotein translocase subunit SecG
MITVVLIIQLMICAALVAVILLQRSEGGALGIGGGGGFMSGRGAANLLTRTTTILGVAFFTVSILLTILFNRPQSQESILQRARQDAPVTAPADKPAEGQTPAAPGGNVLERLGTKPAEPAQK